MAGRVGSVCMCVSGETPDMCFLICLSDSGLLHTCGITSVGSPGLSVMGACWFYCNKKIE